MLPRGEEMINLFDNVWVKLQVSEKMQLSNNSD